MADSDDNGTNITDNTAFTQQRLPAYQPTMTVWNVVGTFVVVGLLFIPLGVGLLITSNGIKEYTIEYTNCTNVNGNQCSDQINPRTENQARFPTCTCTIDIEIEEDMQQPVYFYYKMTNFWQNHFQYMRSQDYAQLSGKTGGLGGSTLDASTLGQFCTPQQYNISVNGVLTDELGTVAPCGAVANTLFNDSFTSSDFVFDKSDLAWNTDHEVKFKNPDASGSCNPDSSTDTNLDPCFQTADTPAQAQPPFWQFPITQVDRITEPGSASQPNSE